MRWRTSCWWALAGSVGLTFLLVLACQGSFPAATPAGMSAPRAPAASIESARAAQLLPSQFESHGLVVRGFCFRHAVVAVCAMGGERQNRVAASSYYGPLYRRPPPDFS